MRNWQFYNDLSDLNDTLYNKIQNYKNYLLINTYLDNTGVVIALYKLKNDIIFAIKGSEILPKFDVKDLLADIDLWVHKYTKQFISAKQYYDRIKSKYSNIIFTGYSLGGSIAQLLCKEFGNETICFEPYGTGKTLCNCINFGNIWDIVFMQNPNQMPGRTYLISVSPPKSGIRDFETHLPFQHGIPSNSKLITTNLEDNLSYFKRNSLKKIKNSYKDIKDYVRDGVIPSTKQRINQLFQ